MVQRLENNIKDFEIGGMKFIVDKSKGSHNFNKKDKYFNLSYILSHRKCSYPLVGGLIGGYLGSFIDMLDSNIYPLGVIYGAGIGGSIGYMLGRLVDKKSVKKKKAKQ